MLYWCIQIHSVSKHVLIQQKKYRFIDISIYHCVLINEFSAMDETLKLTFYRK